jgi:hypothetical protein
MNALQPQHDPSPRRPARSPQAPPPQRRSRTQSRAHSRRQSPHRAAVLEVSLKLTVNLILVATGVCTLARLIPYNMSQQSDLERLRTEVKEASAKVGGLQEDFDRHFDPQQALNVMQEQNIRFNPRQKQVVWLKPDAKLEPDAKSNSTAEVQAAPD